MRLDDTAQNGFIAEAADCAQLRHRKTSELDGSREICDGYFEYCHPLRRPGFAGRTESVEVAGVVAIALVIVYDGVIDLSQRRIGITAIPICHTIPSI